MQQNKENIEQPITSKSEQASNVQFWKKLNSPLDFAICGTALAVILSLVLVLADLGLTSQDSESKEEATTPDSEKSEEKHYQDPRQALDDFLTYLHEGQYEEAAELYGGDYEMLEEYNPNVNPQNRSELLARYCTINGGMCLEPKIMDLQTFSEDHFTGTVRFFYSDGDVYKVGPFAGEEGEPTIFEADYDVIKINDNYKVMQLPPYSS